MTCTRCHHGKAKKFGHYGKHRIQRYRCISCRATFAEPHAPNPLGTMRTPLDGACKAIQCLLEGCSIRSTERLTGLNRNTIMRLLVEVGERCESLAQRKLYNLPVRFLQADEIWCYVMKKEKHTALEESSDIGDQYVFVALDAETKLVICWQVGKRNVVNTFEFMKNTYLRLGWGSRPQITTDGWGPYIPAIARFFGIDVDYAQLVKIYGRLPAPREGYSPSRFVEAVSKTVTGNPDPERVSTSYVERQNLTMRMQMRRFTRLTNAFSKKLDNLRAAVALHFMYYNFCRLHQTLRITPAMEAGIADHVWSVGELIELID